MKTLFISFFALALTISASAQDVLITGPGHPCPLTIDYTANNGIPPLCATSCGGSINIPPFYIGPLTLGCPGEKITNLKVYETGGGSTPAAVSICPFIGPPGIGSTGCGPFTVTVTYGVWPFQLNIDII